MWTDGKYLTGETPICNFTPTSCIEPSTKWNCTMFLRNDVFSTNESIQPI